MVKLIPNEVKGYTSAFSRLAILFDRKLKDCRPKFRRPLSVMAVLMLSGVKEYAGVLPKSSTDFYFAYPVIL